MKLDSELFDSIRVKPKRTAADKGAPLCEWCGCNAVSAHLAPKGRGKEGEYWHFCMRHAEAYNMSYDYFAGMDDDALAAFQKSAGTGHRTTRPIGIRASSIRRRLSSMRMMFEEDDLRSGINGYHRNSRKTADEVRGKGNAQHVRRRTRGQVECRSLELMGLSVQARPEDIKVRFKELVKRHHPDANGGDRSQESFLQSIIEAYNYLRSIGSCD